ncbi:MAG TPA: twin-arginine translocase TatA/TatE family subunit [Acidimicrobiales bacterium]|nr:twin-arginine translocase TatA/TatE family subunit [Acidimicrobiales bacterium]
MGAPELLILLAIILLVAGGTLIPRLARSIGKSKKEFEEGKKQPGR